MPKEKTLEGPNGGGNGDDGDDGDDGDGGNDGRDPDNEDPFGMHPMCWAACCHSISDREAIHKLGREKGDLWRRIAHLK
jgi:hypothetical protein